MVVDQDGLLDDVIPYGESQKRVTKVPVRPDSRCWDGLSWSTV